MNIINKILLWFALSPGLLYRKLDVNTRHLRIILTAKLTMDDRRPNTFHQARPRKPDKAISAATVGTMLLSGFLGTLFLFSFGVSDDLVTQFILYFSVFFVMLVSTLISDFTSVLIDVRDNYIIFPKPVSDKTFVLARLLHILIHVTKIIIPMSLPAIIYLVIFQKPWTAFVFFILMLLASTFSIFLINIIYLIILKTVSPKKFQVIISYVQIFMTIIIFSGYQLLTQQIGKKFTGGFVIAPHFWLWLIPSYWFALGVKFFSTVFLFRGPAVIGALLSILAPPLSLWAVIKYFAPSFNQKLSLITNDSEEITTNKISREHKTVKKILFINRLAKVLAKTEEERMGFLLTWKLTGRSRDFKLKVYPTIGYLLVITTFAFFKNFSLQDLKIAHSDIRIIIMSLFYSSGFLLLVALGQIQFSEKYKAAWFYFTTPINKPGRIFSGALKAMAIKFYVPVVIILSIVMMFLIGVNILPNILLGISNILLGSSLLSLITLRNFPFSALQQTNQKVGAIFRAVSSMGLVSLLAVLHFIIFNIPAVVFISLALSVLANWLVLDYMKNKSWAEILATYNEN